MNLAEVQRADGRLAEAEEIFSLCLTSAEAAGSVTAFAMAAAELARSVTGPELLEFLFLPGFSMAGAVTEIVDRTGLLKVPLRTAFARARGLPRSAWGAAFAHFGLGLTLLGIIGETQWSMERIAELKPGQSIQIRRYDLHFDSLASRQGPNYRELAAHGHHERVLTLAFSEFGRRATPNGTGGTDHGTGTVAFLVTLPVAYPPSARTIFSASDLVIASSVPVQTNALPPSCPSAAVVCDVIRPTAT